MVEAMIYKKKNDGRAQMWNVRVPTANFVFPFVHLVTTSTKES
jgi:hypothetical protein